MNKEVKNAVSDKSGLPDSDSEGGGAVPSTATILCEFCGRRPAKYYLPRLKKWCCKKRADACKGGFKQGPFICKHCGKEHDGTYGTGDFCSSDCANTHSLINARESPEFKKHMTDVGWRRAQSQVCNLCSKEFPSKNSLKRHEIQEHGRQKHAKGVDGWKNEPGRWEAANKKAGETLKRKYASGELKPTWLGRHLTNETREKISKSRIKFMLNHEDTGRRPSVKWYKVSNINGENFSQQGTWERDFALWLNSKGILWIKRKVLNYITEDGIHRMYIPDFYLPELNVYVEIKGLFNEDDKQKMKCVVKSNPKERIYFIHGRKTLQGIIKGLLDLNDSFLYQNVC